MAGSCLNCHPVQWLQRMMLPRTAAQARSVVVTLDELLRRLRVKFSRSMVTMESIDGDVDLTVSDGGADVLLRRAASAAGAAPLVNRRLHR